ncbi:MAG TPA: MarR family transcriptional regulator [Alphaproteobacteria bacterium]|jgi:DNA-binding MarR family transcriptional regulator
MTPPKTSQRRPRDIIRLKSFLPYRLSLLAHRLSLGNADLEAGRHRLTVQEWKVMAIIADHGPLMPADIRRHGTQDKSTISWAIKRLQQRGFLIRRAKDGDGRTFEVRLSEAGWAYYGAIAPKSRRRFRDAAKRLSRAELAQLRRLVDKLDPL